MSRRRTKRARAARSGAARRMRAQQPMGAPTARPDVCFAGCALGRDTSRVRVFLQRHASAERIAERGRAASPRRHTSSDAMAKAKPRAAGSSSSGAKPAWPRVLTQAKRPTLIVVTLFVMFKWILPYLADLTPPGVDVQLIQAEAVKRAARAKDKCATVCDGMNCPAGWQTGRSPEDHCKCICVRTDPSKATAWDRAHNQAQFFPEDETAGATHVKSHEPDS